MRMKSTYRQPGREIFVYGQSGTSMYVRVSSDESSRGAQLSMALKVSIGGYGDGNGTL